MGNCLKRSQTDDISLLRDAPSSNEDSTTIRHESTDQPSYYAEVLQAGMHIPSGSLSQMTEEEHVRIAKRIGLIQHLPVGYYDGTGSRRHESADKDSKTTTTGNSNNQFNLTITEESMCKKESAGGEKSEKEKEEDCMTSSTLSSSSRSECVICMYDFQIGDRIRYLPCLHVYHDVCIDDWLMRSLTCPSCLEPVDAALLQTYENNN